MHKYSISVKWSDEDEGFIATMPELDGLSAFGKTKGEALAELEVAADAYLESWENSGRPLPPPEKILVYSGQLRLRMPKGLHARMVQSASVQGVSLNTYIVSLLSEKQTENEAVALIKKELMSLRTWSLNFLAGTSGSPIWLKQPERKIDTSDNFMRATGVS